MDTDIDWIEIKSDNTKKSSQKYEENITDFKITITDQPIRSNKNENNNENKYKKLFSDYDDNTFSEDEIKYRVNNYCNKINNYIISNCFIFCRHIKINVLHIYDKI